MRDIQSPEPFWSPLRVYHLYRVLLGLLLAILLLYFPESTDSKGGNLELYSRILTGYVIFALIAPLAGYFIERKFGAWGALPGIMIEILLITLLVYSNGRDNNSLYILLIVTVAIGSVLLPARGSYLVASLATLSVLSEYFIQGRKHYTDYHNITEAAFYGISFFITALAINLIVRKLKESEKLAQQQRRQISRLEALNQQIVQRMRTAVMVFDTDQQVLLANKAALELTTEPTAEQSQLLHQPLPDKLTELHQQWQHSHQQSRPAIQLQPGGPMLMVRFADLSEPQQDNNTLTLIFLEDQRQLAQEAQQLKLASLGKLSATVAHEIRNPLSAINHAAELLKESLQSPADTKLLNIINNNVQRMNGLVTDIMDLSRRQAAAAERMNLRNAVQTVVQHWLEQGKEASQFIIEISPNIDIKFDPMQFSQILHNLISNSFRHAGDSALLHLHGGIRQQQLSPWLSIKDDGPGVPPEFRNQLFDPFFTTSRQGTGLGLYVCRELCESNQAQIDYIPHDQGTEFVITFAHPDRNFY